jgi:hypothetical protein
VKLTYVEVKILNGTSLSAEVDLRDRDLLAIQMPTAWDAAGLAFQCAGVAYDGARLSTAGLEPFQNVVDDAGTAIGVTAAASQFIAFREAFVIGLRSLARIKVRSGTNAAPVNQTADRLLTLVCLPFT